MNMKLLIFGPPGAGKGTYASRLSTKMGIPHIAMGDLLREFVKKPDDLALKIKTYMQKGALVPDELVFKVLEQELGKEKGFILDGFPRTKEQAETLNTITKIDSIINLKVPKSVIVERLSSRRQCSKCNAVYNLKTLKPKKEGICDNCNGELYQREDDKPATIEQRFNVYMKQTEPVLQCFSSSMINISNSKSDIPPEIIVDKILKEINQLAI